MMGSSQDLDENQMIVLLLIIIKKTIALRKGLPKSHDEQVFLPKRNIVFPSGKSGAFRDLSLSFSKFEMSRSVKPF